MHIELVQTSMAEQIKIDVDFTSSLVATSNGFEGFAPRLRGFQLDGSVPAQDDRQVWEYNPEEHGRSAWIAFQQSEFRARSFFIPTDDTDAVDYFTIEIVVRAVSGQVIINSVEPQNYYSITHLFPFISGPVTIYPAGVDEYGFVNFLGGDEGVYSYRSYQHTLNKQITKGRRMKAEGSWIAKARTQITGSSEGLATRISGLLKCRIEGTSTYDWYDLGSSTGDSDTIQSSAWVMDTEAANDYDQQEWVFGVMNIYGPASPFSEYSYLEIYSARLDIRVSDFVGASQ